MALAALMLAPPRIAAAQQSGADTVLLHHIAIQARQRDAQIGTANAPAPAAAQYREALADLERGEYPIAATELSAALQRARNNPLYLGDRAYAYAVQGQFDPAGRDYRAAYAAQQRNAWYIAALAELAAAQNNWTEAAGNAQLAANTDSAVVDSLFAPAAATWFASANDRTGAFTWSKLSTQRNPADAQSWLRIALFLRQRQDSSAEGPDAVRRYIALKGEHADRLAFALMAEQVYNSGKTDSGLALARIAAQDSGYREYAAQLYLQAGRDAFQHRDIPNTLALLTQGRQWATPAQLPAFSNITGRAQLLKLQSMLASIEESHNCDSAHVADTLLSKTEQSLREGASFDTARTNTMVNTVLPGFRQNVQSAISSCRQGGAATPRRSTAPRPAPARRP
jgi:hypothetical protein